MKELLSLSSIETIRGYLEVSQSPPIVSLNFFKNLKEIKGESLKQGSALVISNNENLEELWNSTNLNIYKTKIHLEGNSKLCVNNIEKFLKKYYLLVATETNISQSNNGDLAICNFTKLRSKIIEISSRSVKLIWEAFDFYDLRKLLGYELYCKKITNQTGIQESFDTDTYLPELNQEFISIQNTDTFINERNSLLTNLENLEPFTDYAYYIKTKMLSTEKEGGKTSISYFKTSSELFETTKGLVLNSITSDSLAINWGPSANNNLMYYKLLVHEYNYESNFEYQREYCSNG